jgi:branched-subunit amino acid aminotransferase/4-amino-4-deoxychorismate lyase
MRALGCYTGARATRGRVWYAERHARRLARDAALLGIGEVDRALVLRLLGELAAPSRVGQDLKLRVEAHRDAELGVRLRGAATALEPDPIAWRAVAGAHPGPSPASSAKSTERGAYDGALAAARAAGAEEALLFDAAGHLVEGARTSVIVARADGGIATPPLARGAQAGIAREILLESLAELREDDVSAFELRRAREVVAVNAVRGARAIVALDGHPIGSGRPGPLCERLAAALARATD